MFIITSYVRALVRRTEVRVLVAVLSVASAVTVDVVNTLTRRKFDLHVYAGSVKFWTEGGALYDYIRPGSQYGFTYPPFAAFVMSPMAILSWRALVVIQAVITAAVAAAVMSWLLKPLAERFGWPVWMRVSIGLAVLVVLAPVRDVIGYGQVNIILLGLVVADFGWGLAHGRRWAGIGIGIATAIKLVPGLFIVYLLLTRRFRAAITAAGTFVLVSAVAAIASPADSKDYWLRRCWETSRVGNPISSFNQSLRGGLVRIGLGSTLVWVGCCLLILAIWAWRTHRLPPGSERLGLALTGLTACIISPITWVHHLVWVIPALTVALDSGAWILAGTGLFVFATRLPMYGEHTDGVARAVLTSSYLWICVGLLLTVARDPKYQRPPAATSATSDDAPCHERGDLTPDPDYESSSLVRN